MISETKDIEELKEEAEDRKRGKERLSQKHKEEIQVTFRKSMDLLIKSILKIIIIIIIIVIIIKN